MNEGGQAKETDGGRRDEEGPEGRRPARTADWQHQRAIQKFPRAFEIFPLNELRAAADSSPAG